MLRASIFSRTGAENYNICYDQRNIQESKIERERERERIDINALIYSNFLEPDKLIITD